MEDSVIRYVGHDDDGRLRDSIGRQQPTRFNLLWAFRAVPGLADQFDVKVPGSFWFKSDEGEAEVSCPCGETAVARKGKVCECSCERFYLYAGEEIRVANSPVSTRPNAEEPENRPSVLEAPPDQAG